MSSPTPLAAPRHTHRTLTYAALYFAMVFGAGFVLGPIRVLWLVPRLGERTAELLETPIMLAVIVWSARWLVRRARGTKVAWLGVGLLALAMVLAMEFGVVLALRGLTLRAYLASRDPVAGTAYLATLLVFAALPAWLSWRTAPAGEQARVR